MHKRTCVYSFLNKPFFLNNQAENFPNQVVDHLVREEFDRRTVFNALNRRKNGQSILCDIYLGPP